MIRLKTKEQIDLMRTAGKALAQWMESIADRLEAGKDFINGWQIERDFKNFVHFSNASTVVWDSVFDKVKDYGSPICVSINDEIVHSRPTKKPFAVGDVITIDAGLSYKGWMADMARTVICGGIKPTVPTRVVELLNTTRLALYKGEQQCKPGNKISDISAAIAEKARKHGLGVVTKFGGHGIGRDIHEDPHIPNDPCLVWKDAVLREGMVFCIEPMLTLGTGEIVIDKDQWRVWSLDGSLAAHEENMILITEDGHEVLTRTEEKK